MQFHLPFEPLLCLRLGWPKFMKSLIFPWPELFIFVVISSSYITALFCRPVYGIVLYVSVIWVMEGSWGIFISLARLPTRPPLFYRSGKGLTFRRFYREVALIERSFYNWIKVVKFALRKLELSEKDIFLNLKILRLEIIISSSIVKRVSAKVISISYCYIAMW